MVELSYRIFLFLLVFSPLAFGTTELWSLALVEAGCFLACLLYLGAGLFGRLPLHRPPGMAPLLGLAGFMLLQLAPLPPAVLQLISPETWAVYRDSIWLLQPGTWMPLSVAPEATLAQFFRLSAYLAFYLLATQLLSVQERLKMTVVLVSSFAGLYALVGILQFFLPGDKILWVLREWPERAPHSFGTYVNGNHYAGLMEMLLPVILAWFLATRPKVRYGSWRENLVEFLGHPRTSPYVLTGLAAGLIGVSIFFSLSRGGILSTLGSLCLLGLLFLFRKDSRKTGGLIILFMGLILFAVGYLGGDPILDRFERIRDKGGNLADLRPDFWQDSSRIIEDFPWAGSGFGTFFNIYPRYQTTQTGNLFVDHAHNDYLELLTDGGAISAGLVAWFLVTLWRAGFHGLQRRKNRVSIYLGLGSFSGMVALGLHSFTDFNFYIGANGLYFFFVAALFAAASHGRSQDTGGSWSELKLLTRTETGLAAWAIGGLLLAGLLVCGGGLVAAWALAGTSLDETTSSAAPADGAAAKGACDRAIQWDPLNPRYRRISAQFARDAGEVGKESEALVEAVRLAPVDGGTLQQLAQVLDRQGDKHRAEILLRTGARNDPTNHDLLRTYTAWLLVEGRKAEAFREVRTVLAAAPKETWIYLAMMVLHGVDDGELKAALPEKGLAYVAYGNYLLSAGLGTEAEQSYRSAIRFEKSEKLPSTKPFWVAYKYFENEKRLEDALQVILGGIEIFPADAALRRAAGTLYEKLGITYRAVEEYRQALLLDPHNQWTRKKIKVLEEGG